MYGGGNFGSPHNSNIVEGMFEEALDIEDYL
jgi:hypothetical protein